MALSKVSKDIYIQKLQLHIISQFFLKWQQYLFLNFLVIVSMMIVLPKLLKTIIFLSFMVEVSLLSFSIQLPITLFYNISSIVIRNLFLPFPAMMLVQNTNIFLSKHLGPILKPIKIIYKHFRPELGLLIYCIILN